MRWWLNGLRIGGVSLESRLGTGALMGLYWKVVGWVVLMTIVLAGYVVMVVMIATGEPITTAFTNPETFINITFIALAAIGYLAWAMGLNIFMRLYLMRDLWA